MPRPTVMKNGFHVFSIEEAVPRFGSEEIEAALDKADKSASVEFSKPRPAKA